MTSAAFRSSPNIGRLCENLVAVALHRRALRGDLEVFYWQGAEQEEVDFVLKEGPRVTRLIQVCAYPESQVTRSREVRSLLKASRALGCEDLEVLTLSDEGEEQVHWFGMTARVRFIPIWKWLQDPGS